MSNHPSREEMVRLDGGNTWPRAMSVQDPAGVDLVARLAAIGVEEREAKLFLHLCLAGPSRASDAAAAVRLKRTETYRALEALMRKGFVTAHLARPVVYEAVPPDLLFSSLVTEHEERRRDIDHVRERVIHTVTSAKRERETPANRFAYKIIQGRRAILAAIDAGARNARVSHDLVSTALTVVHTSPHNRAYQSMLRRAQEGLPIRLMLRETPGLEHALQPMLACPNVSVRFFEIDHALRFSLFDEREIVYWLVTDPAPGVDARDDVAMWTNAPDFSRSQRILFDAHWTRGRDVLRQ